MKIKGHDVVFLETCWHDFYTECGIEHEQRQKWRIPKLQLYGYIVTETTWGGKPSLAEVKATIQREAKYDLDQREKRKLGIA